MAAEVSPAGEAGGGAGLRGVVVSTLLITPSGALSPGFLSASAVAVGGSLGVVGGLAVSLGHLLFELPYVALLVYWAERLERLIRRFERPLAAATIAMALFFSYSLLASAAKALNGGVNGGLLPTVSFSGGGFWSAVTLGFWFTGFNPYFLVWWATIGLPLVRGAADNGLKGFTVMYLSHVWIDFAWLGLLAAAGRGLAEAVAGYAILEVVLSVVLLAFAADMTLRSFAGRKLLPF